MDEETTGSSDGFESEVEFSGDTTVTKQKKAAPVKKKVDKEAATAKKSKKEISTAKADKTATSSKKANNEAGVAKQAEKKANNAIPPVEKKKSILELVCEAIETLGESRKGLSVQAIKKYVKGRQGQEMPGLNTYVNKALNKGIEKGILVRPAVSKDATGAVGYFRLAKIEPQRRIKRPRGKIDSEHASDSEAAEKPVKPRKRNLSDTYIEEMRESTPKPTTKEVAAPKDTKKTKKLPKKNANEKKDASDSEGVVKNTKRKPTKSYSSDTEVDLKKNKIAKSAKNPVKKTDSDKSKAAKAGSPSKVSKAKVKKLYNSKDEKPNKSAKTRVKKE